MIRRCSAVTAWDRRRHAPRPPPSTFASRRLDQTQTPTPTPVPRGKIIEEPEHKRPVRTNHHHRSNTMADSGGLSANNAAAANEDDDANTAPFPDTVRRILTHLCFYLYSINPLLILSDSVIVGLILTQIKSPLPCLPGPGRRISRVQGREEAGQRWLRPCLSWPTSDCCPCWTLCGVCCPRGCHQI